MIFNKLKKARKDFPILNKNIIYFDNACMSLKPIPVLKKMNEYYTEYTSCAGRSAHKLSKKLEIEIKKARNEIKSLIGAKSEKEIIFTRNTTEGINLIANTFPLEKGDEVVISDKEHNSNLLPWLKLKKQKGIVLKICKSNNDGTFNINNFENCFSKKTKLVSIVHTSNLDGVTNPIKEISKITHKNKAILLVDAAQSIPHKKVDVSKLNIDFLAFSGHKMLGPSGTGVLYGKESLLEKLPQFLIGGETVMNSTYNDYEVEELPMKFEAGLQDYAGIVGFGEAARYLRNLGLHNIEKHELKLNKILTNALINEPKIQILGPKDPSKRSGVFSFNIKGLDPHHVSMILDKSANILTRSGAHCVHSWFNARNLKGSCRASFYFYNTEEEVEIFVNEVKKIIRIS